MTNLPSSDILALITIGQQAQGMVTDFGDVCVPLGSDVKLAVANTKVELAGLVNELYFELGKAYAQETRQAA